MQSTENTSKESFQEYLERSKNLKGEARKEIEKSKVLLGVSDDEMKRDMGFKFARVASQELLNQCLQSIFDSASGFATNITPFERGCLEGMYQHATKDDAPF